MVTGATGSNRLRRFGRRILRLAARFAAAVAALLVCIVVLLLLAPVRGRLLQLGLGFADGRLPGELRVSHAVWPRLGRLEFADLVWLAEASGAAATADTLAHIDRLVLAVDLGALRSRDVKVDSLLIRVSALDVPAITSCFPVAAPVAADTAAGPAMQTWTAGFPRSGAVAALPSVVVERLELAVARARVARDLTLGGLRLGGQMSVAAGRQPAVEWHAGGISVRRGGANPFELDLDTLTCAAAYDTVTGRVNVDSLAVVVSAAGPPTLAARWRDRAPLRLGGHGSVTRRDTAWAATVDLALRAPGASLLGEAWPQALDPAAFDTVVVDLHAAVGVAPHGLDAAVDVDLGATPWLERGRLTGRAELDPSAPVDGRFVVDTLDVALAGVALQAGGGLDRGELDAALTIEIATPVPVLQAFLPQADQVVGSARVEATVRGPPTAPVVVADLAVSTSAGPLIVPQAAIHVQGDRDRLRIRFAAGGGLARDDRDLLDAVEGSLELRPVLGKDNALPEHLAADFACNLIAPNDAGLGVVRLRAAGAPAAPRTVSVELDTVGIVIPGLAVHGSGRRDTTAATLSLAATLRRPCPLLELALPQLVGADYAVDLAVDLAGSSDDPRIDLELTGTCDAPFAIVPGVEVSAHGGRRDLQATVRADGGIAIGGQVVADSLIADLAFRPATGDSLPLRAGIAVRRGGIGTGALLAVGGTDSVLTVRLDTLAVDVAAQSLRLTGPAVVRWDTTARELAVSHLALAGSAGTVEAEGFLGRSETRLQAGVDLDLPEVMLQALVPLALWSENGGMDLGLAGDVDLEATAEQTRFRGGLDFEVRPHRTDERLGLSLDLRLAEGDSSGLGARFAMHLADTTLLHGEVLWPGRFAATSGRWIGDPARALEVTVPAQTLPLTPLQRLQPRDMSITGDVTFAAAASVPLALADSTGGPRGGTLSGSLRAPNLRVNLANNSRVEVNTDIQIEGTPADPRLSGRIRIESGFLRIPEIPRSLHPVNGTPLLWTAAAAETLGVAADTLAIATAGWRPDQELDEAPAFVPDLDLVIEAPGNLRIHGYGLEVEVAANVAVRRGYDKKRRPGPALDGEAHAVRGTLRFMNRTFEIRTAEITFTGEVPANPLLDLQLVATISGTTVRLHVTGRADAPIIDLTSDPDMDKADIMAFLLFGRPLNDLDADQRGMTREEKDPAQQMRENLAGLALAFGTADLQSSVSSTFGVDIVEVGSDSQGGSTLTAGKFISPKILVKYNASLEKSGTYFVTLEYMLTQVFRVVSTYGQGEEASGLELKWERRY